MTSPDFLIRPARLTDADLIADFNACMARETEELALDAGTLVDGVRAVLADPAKGMYYVAEHKGAIIAQLLITFEWSDWRNGCFWWLQSVYVAPQHRRSGIFRSLFEHIRTQAAARPDVCGLRLYVERGNAAAIQTYERLGLGETCYEMMELTF